MGAKLMLKIKYFEEWEFRCKCDVCQKNNHPVEMADLRLSMLEEARRFSGIPYTLSSAYRCWVHNLKVGGKAKSSHRFGLAVDIEAKNSRQRMLILRGLIHAGFDRIGMSKDKKFIHVDVDFSKPSSVLFLY